MRRCARAGRAVERLRFTKIIATVGPASASLEMLRRLIRTGADCFRLNFSHGDGARLAPWVELVREAARLEERFIPILADIQGPKMRIGSLPAEGVILEPGAPFTVTQRPVAGDARTVHSPYEFLAQDAQPGGRILLADGAIELRVEKIEGQDVQCVVVHGGKLSSNKGINLPGAHLSVETLTEKDKRDLEFVAGSDIDVVAISFVRRAQDIRDARALLGNVKTTILAKLERPEALQNLSEILEVADGVMVARGDLGVELPFERVPFIQKQILQRAAARGKWAVVATEMLRSMVEATRPTRAEATDVSNAVLDGADAVMLSEETAVGAHPDLVVDAMTRIVREADGALRLSAPRFEQDITSFSAGAAGAAVSAAERLNARAIVALAGSNVTALLLSKWRSPRPIIALSASEPTLRRLNALRGVIPAAVGERADMDRQIAAADRYLIERGLAESGDTIVVVGAIPLGEGRETNSIRFHKVLDDARFSGQI